VLTGNRLRESYERAAVVVVPSLWPEVFGQVAIEAMGTARPVVASRVGGIPEIVADGHTGHLVSPGDEAGLAAAILDLLIDKAKAAAFGAAEDSVRNGSQHRLVQRLSGGRVRRGDRRAATDAARRST